MPMDARTRWRVCSRTAGSPLLTRETVLYDTPACAATSFSPTVLANNVPLDNVNVVILMTPAFHN